ncbi:MAG: acetylxylan esterase [Anaerolineaceae bacterium]|nr:acetylxylan esterase [Anaerolineaceae bacterium]
MAFFDMPLDQLESYKPELTAPPDFDEFWEQTYLFAHNTPMKPVFNKVQEPLDLVDVFDVSFPGYAGQPVKAWLLIPKGTEDPLPCVVEYIGYGGGRGRPVEWLTWPNAGFAHFVMDTRGQGSVWREGDTPDVLEAGSSAQVPGFMTRGILSPETYYYRRLFIDAMRAVEAAKEHSLVDVDRIAITGSSQGGGVALAVAGLMPEIPVAMPDVPFLCDFKRATQLVDSHPYQEIVQYCRVHREKVEQVFKTLSYFDGINFANRAKATALFSTALMDDTCPPSTVFAAYNHYAGVKQIRVYPFNQHDGGGVHHLYEKIQFLRLFWH